MQYATSFGAFLVGLLTACETAGAVPFGGTRHSVPVKSEPRGRASLKQVRNANYEAKFSRHGALAREKAYLKFHATLPDELTTAVTNVRTLFRAGLAHEDLDRRATGSVVNTPEAYDVEYLTPVQIGTPPQTLNLNLDTGSSDLWVYSTETPASEVNGQEVYSPNTSSTADKQSGLTWSISYGDGSTSQGEVYKDTVTMGGLSVANVAVEVATEVSTEFTADSEIDGLLGLSFSSLNMVLPTQQQTFFDLAKDQLDSFLFTADLKAGEPGTYNFGYIDESLYTGDIAYTDVDSSMGYWTFTASGYQIGDNTWNSTTITGIPDTGTTLLMLPQAIVDAYYAQIDAASYDTVNSGYVFPCTITPPDFTLGIGDEGAKIVVPGKYMNYSPIDSAGATCYGGIQDDTDIGFSIFGDVFLKSAFVVFEGGDAPRVGFASKDLGLEAAAGPQDVVVVTVTVTVTA